MIVSFLLTKVHIFMLGYIVTGFPPFGKYFLPSMKTGDENKNLVNKRIRHIRIRNMPEKEDRI